MSLQRDLEQWVRDTLSQDDRGGQVATAVAAAAAEECYRLSDAMPEWVNETSELWRAHLDRVWQYLGGDGGQYHALSAALATFLLSPLNHNDGQDGPDDADRPQTTATRYALLGALFGVTDAAPKAVAQVFDCIDLRFDGGFPDERPAVVDRAAERIRGWVGTARAGAAEAAAGWDSLPAHVIAELRGTSSG